MRFKTTLHNTQILINVLDSLSHIHSLGLFSLSTSGLGISIDTNTVHTSNPENCFVELKKDQLFENFKIESRAENHLIPFVAQFAALRQALESVRSASEVVLKLVKRKEQAFLQCEASDLPSLTYSQQTPQADGSSGRGPHQVYQFIPIQVLAVPDYLERASEPELTDPRVKLLMPPLKKLQSILEKMKSVGQTIIEFAMHSNGNFNVTAIPNVGSTDDTSNTRIKTFFKKLSLPSAAALNPGGVVEVVKGKILIKRLQTMLHCRNLTAAQTIGVITPEGCFVLYLRLAQGVGTMTYYLPLVAADDDQDGEE